MKYQLKLVQQEASMLQKAREERLMTSINSVSRKTQSIEPVETVQQQTTVSRKAREGILVTTSTIVFLKTRCEEIVQTGSTRSKCAAEGPRKKLFTNRTNKSRERRKKTS